MTSVVTHDVLRPSLAADYAAEAMRRAKETSKLLNVYVHLAHGYDARDWERRWRSGELIGFNEPSPYGYHHVRSPDVRIRFSADATESKLGRAVRGGMRLLLGFDLVHAWRNRRALDDADVIWTHTESQHLAIALLLKALPKHRRPKLLAQSVWLIDAWERFGWARCAFYRWIMKEADILTFHSPLNRERARALFPDKWCESVPFGISTDVKHPPRCEAVEGRNIRVFALGNDRHRDWPTLLAAFGDRPGFDLVLATSRLKPRRVAHYGNLEIVRPKRNDELLALYHQADIVVLPLLDNMHASGATVLQEAALAGRPVISTQTGGLYHYFNEDEVTFVPPGDPDALRAATIRIATDPALAMRKAKAAQARMHEGGLSSRRLAEGGHQPLALVLEQAPLERAPAFGEVEVLLAPVRGAAALLDIALGQQVDQHARQALLGDPEQGQQLGDVDARPGADEMQRAVMRAPEARLGQHRVDGAREVAMGEEQQFLRGPQLLLAQEQQPLPRARRREPGAGGVGRRSRPRGEPGDHGTRLRQLR